MKELKLGQIVVTQGVDQHIKQSGPSAVTNLSELFTRYKKGDWGDLCDDDKKMNDEAVESDKDSVLAKYSLAGKDVYLITEWDRSVTTVLFPEEYYWPQRRQQMIRWQDANRSCKTWL